MQNGLRIDSYSNFVLTGEGPRSSYVRRGAMRVGERWKRIDEARRLLGLPQKVTRLEVQDAYRRQVRMVRDLDDAREADERLVVLNDAYRLIMAFVDNYTVDLAPNEDGMTDEEWWMFHFGQDPVWSKEFDD